MLAIGTVVRATLPDRQPLAKVLGAHAVLDILRISISRWVAVPATHKLSPSSQGCGSRRMATPSFCSSFSRSRPSAAKL